ncbi:CwfJ C-terminus 1-domain-containing protein-like protein [Pisolithus microcarpus]|nr:CwfJ C-terminus 1-domain-containing protein-like protein [Pisolithus microcarpus]
MTTPNTTQSVKILAVGAALGSVRDLFAKIKSIDAKHGKFDCVLCVGDFFGPLQDASAHDGTQDEVSQLLNGNIQAPLKCYIMQGNHPLPEDVIEKYADTGGELCKDVVSPDNLSDKSALVTTGASTTPDIYASSEAAPGFALPFYTAHTVERLLSNTLSKSDNGDWPASITSNSPAFTSSPMFSVTGSPRLDDVIRKIKPRYHFAGGRGADPPVFWEREPFLWEDEGDRITRFISLGAFGSERVTGKKERVSRVVLLHPSGSQAKRPFNVTKSPFTDSAIRPHKRTFNTAESENFIWGNVEHVEKRSRTDGPSGEKTKPPSGYKCKRCGSSEHLITDCPERTRPPEGYVCRICSVPGHLIRDCPTRHPAGDVGGRKPKEGYLCHSCGSGLHYIEDCPVASQHPSRPRGERAKKGPPKEIGPDECWFCLSNPNLAKHLIVSIGTECYLTLPKGQIIPTQSAAAGSNISLVPGGGHVLIVPIAHQPTYTTISPDIAPPIIEETDKYKSALRNLYAEYGAAAVFFEVGRLSSKGGHAHIQAVPIPRISFEADTDGALEECRGGRHSYFRVDLPDGGKMVHLMRPHAPFSIQFGRQVLVTLLNMTDRT